MNLGENIYRFRTERNMSQGDLADALDVSRQSVSKWENNSATPELEKLMKLSELFGVTLDQLVGSEEPVTPPPEIRSPEIPPARQSMPVHRILGIILLCFGLLTFLILTLMGSLLDGFLFGAPLITVGIICTVCTDNLPIRCWWGIFAVSAPVACLFILSMVSRAAFVCLAALLVWFVILLIWTFIDIRKGRIGNSAKKMVLGCILFSVAVYLITGIAMSPLANRPSDHYTEYSIEPSMIATNGLTE